MPYHSFTVSLAGPPEPAIHRWHNRTGRRILQSGAALPHGARVRIREVFFYKTCTAAGPRS